MTRFVLVYLAAVPIAVVLYALFVACGTSTHGDRGSELVRPDLETRRSPLPTGSEISYASRYAAGLDAPAAPLRTSQGSAP